MIVVSDSSPLNYLALIGEERLLPILFEKIVIPRAVFEELNHPAAPPEIRGLIDPLPPWLQVHQLDLATPLVDVDRLDPGEAEAIRIALHLRADLILIDEWLGRQAAEGHGLKVVGTIGILERAIRAGLADGPTLVTRLKSTSFRASPRLLALLEETRPSQAKSRPK